MELIQPDKISKCLYCQVMVRYEGLYAEKEIAITGEDPQKRVIASKCPNCEGVTIVMQEGKFHPGGFRPNNQTIIWPLSSGRPPVPGEVPSNIAGDYNESCLVLPYSPKASAALSRRCLQTILTDYFCTTKDDLSQQITEVLPKLPSYIAENLDAIRNIGNFAAHEKKSKISGLILDVEPNEAEWNLDVLELLFDFCYVYPAKSKKKRDELNQKLAEAGKPNMKEA